MPAKIKIFAGGFLFSKLQFVDYFNDLFRRSASEQPRFNLRRAARSL